MKNRCALLAVYLLAALPICGAPVSEFSGRILIATRDGNLSLTPGWSATPLFRGEVQSTAGAADSGIWWLLEPSIETAETSVSSNGWDYLQFQLKDGILAGIRDQLLDAEPDVRPRAQSNANPWKLPSKHTPDRRTYPRLRALDGDVARQAELTWPFDEKHSQITAARNAVLAQFPIDIAHPVTRLAVFDTGFTNTHLARPMFMDLNRSADFTHWPPWMGGAHDDLKGRAHALPGHGIATLAALSGRITRYVTRTEDFEDYFGAAPQFPVAMMRISSSLESFFPAAMAGALAHAASNRFNAVSISLFGPPSSAVRDAVNYAYHSGVAIFAAAGEVQTSGLLGPYPSTSSGFPARFSRVMSVEGLNYESQRLGGRSNKRGWESLTDVGLKGRYGPCKPSNQSLAAYAENIAIALPATAETITFGPGSAFAATQAAGAAALWMQKYQCDLPTNSARVDRVFAALLDSSVQQHDECDPMFPVRILKANNALSKPPAQNPPSLDRATLGFEWFGLPGDSSRLKSLQEQLARAELAQLVYFCGHFERVYGKQRFESDQFWSDQSVAKRRRFLTIAYEQPCSAFLHAALFDAIAKLKINLPAHP